MKARIVEKTAAVICALCLTAGVMSGAVFAKDEESRTSVLAAREEADGPASSEASQEALPEAEPTPDATPEVTDNRDEIMLYVDGAAWGTVPILGGVPYMNVMDLCEALELNVAGEVSGDVFTLWGDAALQAAAGDIYYTSSGRYIPVPGGVRVQNGQAYLPVEALVKCLGASAAWDTAGWRLDVRRDGAPLQDGDTYYEETDVYWLSRMIYAEAGGQQLKNQIAVGNVILNRVNDDRFAGQNNVYDVIFAKNQFDVVINGMIYMEPDEAAVIAAKLALEGYNMAGDATYFADQELGEGYECIAWIGDLCFMNET